MTHPDSYTAAEVSRPAIYDAGAVEAAPDRASAAMWRSRALDAEAMAKLLEQRITGLTDRLDMAMASGTDLSDQFNGACIVAKAHGGTDAEIVAQTHVAMARRKARR